MRLVDLACVGRHLDPGAPVNQRDVGLAPGGHLQSDGAAGGVEGDVAAADHDDPGAHRRRSAEVDGAQQLDRPLHAVELGAGDLDSGAPLQPGGQVDGAEAVGEQPVDREVGAGALVQAQLDAPGEDLVDLALDGGARQAVVGDAGAQHAAGHRLGLEDGGGVAQVGEVAGGGQAGRPAAHHGDLLVVDDRGRRHRQRGADLVGHEALEGGDGDRLVDGAARAGGLAQTRADASADAGKRVGLGGHAIGLGEAPGGDQGDVALSRGVHGAGALTGRPALALYVERGRHGVGEGPVDGAPLGDAEIEVVAVAHRAHGLALAAAHAGLGDVARLVAQRHAKLAGRARDLADLGQRVQVHARLEGGGGQARRQ